MVLWRVQVLCRFKLLKLFAGNIQLRIIATSEYYSSFDIAGKKHWKICDGFGYHLLHLNFTLVKASHKLIQHEPDGNKYYLQLQMLRPVSTQRLSTVYVWLFSYPLDVQICRLNFFLVDFPSSHSTLSSFLFNLSFWNFYLMIICICSMYCTFCFV